MYLCMALVHTDILICAYMLFLYISKYTSEEFLLCIILRIALSKLEYPQMLAQLVSYTPKIPLFGQLPKNI